MNFTKHQYALPVTLISIESSLYYIMVHYREIRKTSL